MSEFQDRMKDYVPVAERLAAFVEAHPEGSIQSEIVELTDTRVTVKAYAYRTADDTRPGVGHSSLNIPGSTPYTKGSEIENAETSAWGRAIAALGFEVKRGIASSEDVRNKQPAPRAPGPDPIAVIRDRVIDILHERHMDADALQLYADKAGIVKGERATLEQWQAILVLIERPASEPAAEPVTEVALTASAMPPAPSIEPPEATGLGTTAPPAPIEAGQEVGAEEPSASAAQGTPDPASSQSLLEATVAATGGTVLPPSAVSALERANKRAAATKPAERKPVNDPTQETLEIPA